MDESSEREQMTLRQQIVWPSTPEASSLGEYGDIDVNLYTGSANVNLAGPSLQGNHINMPVSINYATGGIKVEDPGTWVGLGWTMVAGGSITRSVRNVPDTKANYYDYATEIENRLIQPAGTPDFDWYDFYRKVARNEIEFNHDIYYYSFNGRSGKFYISPTKEIFLSEDSDISIEPIFESVTDEILSFTIHDEFGHRYTFDVVEEGRMQLDDVTAPGGDPLAGDSDITNSTYDRTYNNTWHLSEIRSYGSFETIELGYHTISGEFSYPINSAQSKSRTFTTIDNNMCCGGLPGGSENDGGGPVLSILNRRYISHAELFVAGEPIERLDFMISENTCTNATTVDATDRKLDRIEVSRRGLDDPSGTIYHDLLDYRFTYDCSTNRLTLLTYGETTPGANDYALKPPHSFEYIDALPASLTSTSIDHWGYYNGANNSDNLIPTYSSVHHSFSGADRDVDPAFSDHGSLNRIHYPTGGYSEFSYGSHTRKTTGTTTSQVCNPLCQSFENCNPSPTSDCCDSQDYVSSTYLFTPTIDDVNDGVLVVRSDSLCGGGGAQALMTLFTTLLDSSTSSGDNTALAQNLAMAQASASANNWIGAVRVIATPVGGSAITLVDQSHTEPLFITEVDLSALTAGVNYTLEFSGFQTLVTATLYHELTTATTGVEDLGGIRMEELTNYESDGTILTRKRYEYDDAAGNSTGRLMNEVVYESISTNTTYPINEIGGNGDPCEESQCSSVTVSATSRSTLGTTQGSIVGYDRVTEVLVSNVDPTSTAGHTVHHYINVPHSQNPNNLDHVRNGRETLTQVYHTDGRLLVSNETTYAWDVADNARETDFYTYRITPSSHQDNRRYLILHEGGYYFWSEEFDDTAGRQFSDVGTKYEHGDIERMVNYTVYQSGSVRSEYFYDDADQLIDKLVTIENYSYDDLSHLQMTQSEMTNSDDKVYTTDYRHLDDYTPDGTIATLLNDQHKLLPAWQSIYEVDGIQVDGHEYTYDELGSVGSPITADIPMIKTLARYERTWDSNQDILPGEWVIQSTIDGYEFGKGLAAQITDRGWIPRSYDYNLRGSPTMEQYGAYSRALTYFLDTHLLYESFEIDSTKMRYAYDDLLRSLAHRNNRQAVTFHRYNYGTGSELNHVFTTQSIPLPADRQIRTLSYVDGIGRQVQEKRLGQDPNDENMSILTDIDYDEYGRPHRTYEPIAAAATLTSYSPSTQSEMTETVFERSPLHRQESTTPPSWHATRTTYSTNITDEVINHTTGTAYSPGTLYKISSIDPEGQTTEIFTDRRGNQILSRVKETATTIDTAFIADTYTTYDLKDRPILTLPPETNQTNTDLIHTLVYSGDDLVLVKDDPDCAPVEHAYDLRDLLIARQDGERLAEGKWYRIVHDVYGNSLTEGFSDQPTSPIADTLITSEWGLSGITKGKLLQTEEIVLGAPDSMTITKSYSYDDKGRRNVTRCNSILHRAPGSIVSTVVYDAQDLITEEIYEVIPDQIEIRRRWTHDHIGRQKESYITVTTPDPDQPNGLMQWSEQKLSDLSYNAKELITDLNIGNNLQNVDFGYNPRRLLRNLNTSFSGFVSTDDPVTGNKDLFGMNIGYESEVDSDFIGVQVLTDGNISNIQWRYRFPDNTTSSKTRYRYKYDFLKRLTEAADQTSNAAGDYSTAYSYQDKRGNIASLSRMSEGDMIDNLSYDYHSGTNRIKSVDDTASASFKPQGFKGNTSLDYIENDNGYITMDAETGAKITRDHNNLMTTISIDSTLFIHNFRTANGQLHRRLTDSSGVVTIIDRIGSIEYRNGAISVIHHNDGYITLNRPVAEELRLSDEKGHTAVEEGVTIHSDRVLIPGADETNTGQEFINLMEGFMVMPGAEYLAQIDTFVIDGLSYYYTIKDHLGSPRVVFSDLDGDRVPTVEDITNYYPFGLEWSEPQPDRIENYRQSYNNKEAVSYTNYLEFEARCYLKSINIFDGPDPISSQFPHVNSYNYAELSPVANIDLWGLQKYRAVANFIFGHENKGSIQTASDHSREHTPGIAFVQDATFAVAEFFGFNAVDNHIADGNTAEAIAAGLSAGIVTRNGKSRVASGSSSRFNTRNNTTSRAGQFTEKTSLELDPPSPNSNLSTSTVQRVNDVTLDPAVNANSLRPGDPTAGPVVSGNLGKAAIITIAGAVGVEAISNTNAPSSTPTIDNGVAPIDNTAVRIVIMEPLKN